MHINDPVPPVITPALHAFCIQYLLIKLAQNDELHSKVRN